jgi:hypothetical protein
MTINLSDNSPRVNYTVAAGVTQSSFTVPFDFFEEGDVNVYVDGVLKTITTDYTISGGSGTGGTVTMSVTGISGGSSVVLTRDLTIERTTDFPTSGPFDVTSLNTELDRFTAMSADLKDQVDRALQLTDYDVDANLTLPDLNSRKGKVLAFDATTGDLVNGPSTAGVTTVAAAAADIATLADIQDGTVATNAITDAAAIKTNITTVAGIASNVTTVAGNTANINTVSGNTANINTVAGINANVTTVAGISSDVTAAAGISADITAVVADATDIGTVSANIADVNTVAGISADVSTVAADGTDIGVVAGISSDVTTVSGIASNVTSVVGNSSNINAVAGNAANINAVAADATDIGTVSSNIANVNTVASNTSNINAVVADATDIGTVATNIANVNTTASNIANVNSVAGNSANINAVAADATDIGTVSTNIANVNTVAGINADVTTVAGIAADVTAAATNASDISAIAAEVAKVVTVANDLNEAVSEIDTVANSIANVDLVGASITDVNTVASNLSGITAFADVYASGPTDPTTNLNEGDLFFNTTSDTLKVYNGTAWEAGVTAGSGFLPLSGGQLTGNLTFSSTQTVDGRDVSVDGAKLDGIEAGATADQTASEILTEIKTVDGSGSGLDADLLDGQQGSYYLDANNFTNMPPSDVVGDTTPQLGGNLDTNGNDITFGNNDKAIFGAGKLDIHHDGADNLIRDLGTGNNYIQTNNSWRFTDVGNNETHMIINDNGAIHLYYDNATKLSTSATGVSVTGTVAATAFTGDGSGLTGVEAFPSGTLMLFQQTSAPTGWTKQTTHNDKALRVVSGTVGSGGSSGFTTAFGTPTVTGTIAGSTGSHTLTTAEMPSHNHTFDNWAAGYPWRGGSYTSVGGDGNGGYLYGTVTVSSTGGGGSHSHSLSASFSGGAAAINVQYVDLIIASKN